VTNSGQYSLVFQSAIPYGAGHDHMTFIDNVSILADNLVEDGSFETVSQALNSTDYTVSFGSLSTNAVSDWAFGISGNSAYDGIITAGGFGVQVIEDGNNAAFVQGTGCIFQDVALLAGTYNLSFYAMGRTSANGGNGADPVTVSVGSFLNENFTPNNAVEDDANDWIQYSYAFKLSAAGNYALQFLGSDPYVAGSDDHMTMIDNVAIVPVFSVPPPQIISEPSAQEELYVGQSAQFTVQTVGISPISYQWLVETNGNYVNLINGGRITGATSATLIISNLSASDTSNYKVFITNVGGTTNSTATALTILSPPSPGSPCGTVTIINPSFEDNQMTNDTYTTGYGTLDPQTGIPGWEFSSSGGDSFSGIVTEAGSIFGTPKYIPQCWQAAFIQGTAQFSQSATFQSAGTYVIRFQAEGWSIGKGEAEPIVVSVDNKTTGTFTPLTTQWSLYATDPINLTAEVHVISFTGTVPFTESSGTSFIDAVEVVTSAEAAKVNPPISPVYDIVFVGDSITYGATLADPATQASAVQCMQSLGTRFNMAVRMSNQGHSGSTTVDWLPSSPFNTGYFQGAMAAAASLETNQRGQLIFSIMLGANDSAQSGTDGSPVSSTNYQQNLQVIIDQFLTNYPNAFIFVHYPTWYSTNTHNGALYGPAGAALLKSYLPRIDLLLATNLVLHPGRVFAGDKLAYGYFETNYLTLLTPESGVDGTFYLHPNASGAVVLGAFWANAIVAPLNVVSNDAYVAWLQSSDLTPGLPGSGFSDTPTNSLISNGVSYGNPNGLRASFVNNSLDVSADVRDDNNLMVVLEVSNDLLNWNPLSWTNIPNQNGVATGFIRDEFQIPTSLMSQEQFYRLMLNYY
jgi:lysophospholipase L1-like esterase